VQHYHIEIRADVSKNGRMKDILIIFSQLIIKKEQAQGLFLVKFFQRVDK